MTPPTLAAGAEAPNVAPMLSSAPMASPAAFAAERVGAITNCLGSVGTTLLPTAINAGLGVFGLALLYVGAKTIIGAPPDPIKKLVG